MLLFLLSLNTSFHCIFPLLSLFQRLRTTTMELTKMVDLTQTMDNTHITGSATTPDLISDHGIDQSTSPDTTSDMASPWGLDQLAAADTASDPTQDWVLDQTIDEETTLDLRELTATPTIVSPWAYGSKEPVACMKFLKGECINDRSCPRVHGIVYTKKELKVKCSLLTTTRMLIRIDLHTSTSRRLSALGLAT